jgi:predicted nucleic acid-binding protein
MLCMAKKGRRKKPGDFVLDCSVTMAWYFKDEANAYANAVRKSLSRARAVVPGLWPLEVANTLALGERRRRSTEAEASKWLRYLRMLPIGVDDETAARSWSEVLHVARSYQVSAYNAVYLELAIRLGLPVASLDDALKAAAAAAGVADYQP